MKTLIVEDEILAREKLKLFLEDAGGFELIHECGNGIEALQYMEAEYPDVLFLDIQMPELDGISLLRNIEVHKIPCIILVTAYDTYALEAFELHALDYLLKPFDKERFNTCVKRIKSQMQLHKQGHVPTQLASFLKAWDHPKSYTDRVVVKEAGKISFVETKDLDWVEASGNYLTLHIGTDKQLIRETMHAFESKLDPNCFMRVHRSSMVNIQSIQNLEKLGNAEFSIQLKSGKKVFSSRSYFDAIVKKLGL